MDATTIKRRVGDVRRRMQAKTIDLLVLTGHENVTYLTGFAGHDSWALIGRRVTLLTDSRYTEQAEAECVGCRIVERSGPIAPAAAGLINRLKTVKTVGLEDSCSVATLGALRRKTKPRLKPISGIVEGVRRTKDAGEVKAIRKAAAVAWQALSRALPQARIGMTEMELAGILDFQIRQLGYSNSFESIVAFGPNGSRNHHQPGSRRLRRRDSILIDFGACVDGYCSDMTRCFAVGAPNKFYARVYDAVFASHQTAARALRAGTDLQHVDAEARRVLAERKLAVFGHGTGHGLGLQVHETPFLSALGKGKLAVGDTVTIEPGVYYPGRFGIRHEDDYLVTENGCKNLSKDRRFGFSSAELPVLDVK